MEELIVYGKNFFSGRQGVWQEALDLIQENFFFGNDNSYMFNNKMASAHNSLLALLFMFGIVPTIIAIVVMFRTYKYAAQRGTPLAIKLIFCCIFIMTFETLLTDANTYYYFALLFLPEGTKE
jgi:O-antigen ligase